MASVVATAKSGAFHQPVPAYPWLDGRTIATVERSLSPSTAAQLRAMTRRTVVSGTAREAMAGLGGDSGAKTGSAEADAACAASSVLYP